MFLWFIVVILVEMLVWFGIDSDIRVVIGKWI